LQERGSQKQNSAGIASKCAVLPVENERILQEEIMNSNCFGDIEAICEPRARKKTWNKAIVVGREEGTKNTLLETAQLILPPEIVAHLMSITDTQEMKTAIVSAFKGNAL